MLEIKLTPALIAKFEQSYTKSDDCWIWTAGIDGRGYGHMASGHGTSVYKAHRMAYAIATGQQLGNKLVDHICHTPACVRPDHLRLVDHKQNGENRAGLQRNNASGVQGVYWNASKGVWHARVQHHGARIHVGFFNTISEAEAAVVAKRLELFTHNEVDRAAA